MNEPLSIMVASFRADPHAWFDWLRSEMHQGRWELVAATISPTAWRNSDGHAWRIVRTDGGIEIRPELESPFIRYGESPKVTALAIGPEIGVELTCRTGRWVDHFPLDAFDVAELGKAMIEERALPHDNLPQLFPPTRASNIAS